jgi:hypothetical protein
VAYGGRSPDLYENRKLARKCHKNSEKKKERVGKEKRVRGGTAKLYRFFASLVSISSISTLLAPILRKRN